MHFNYIKQETEDELDLDQPVQDASGSPESQSILVIESLDWVEALNTAGVASIAVEDLPTLPANATRVNVPLFESFEDQANAFQVAQKMSPDAKARPLDFTAWRSLEDLFAEADFDEFSARFDDQPEYGRDEFLEVLWDRFPLAGVVHAFRRWLHLPDIQPLLAVLAAYVANRLPGDPVWLMLVGQSSGGKSEALNALLGQADVHPAATITESALLSGSTKASRGKKSTGGLLRRIGDFGVLLCKDFTSILSMNRDRRTELLAALRRDFHFDHPDACSVVEHAAPAQRFSAFSGTFASFLLCLAATGSVARRFTGSDGALRRHRSDLASRRLVFGCSEPRRVSLPAQAAPPTSPASRRTAGG